MSQDIQSLLPELKRLAEAATPGEWDSDSIDTPYRIFGGEVVGGDPTGLSVVYTAYDAAVDGDLNPEPKTIVQETGSNDGRFIAAANPATLSALIAHIEALERQLAYLRQAPVEYTLDHVDLARDILSYLGYAISPSREPGADSKVDRLAAMIAKSPIAPAERQAPEGFMQECRDFWSHYSFIPEGAQVDMQGEVDAMLARMDEIAAAPSAGQAKREGDQVPNNQEER